MGWARGSELAEEVWLQVRNHIPEGNQRIIVARHIIAIFEDYDCDTIDEAETLCKDARRRTIWNGDGDPSDDELYEPLDEENHTQNEESSG